MASNSILLRGGTILTHGDGDHVKPIEADLLIEGNNISKIEKGIKVGAETEVIDCTGKLLSPGFVDTHHHVWQTLLKGRHANHLLMDYFPSGMLILKIVFVYANVLRKFHVISVYLCRPLLGSTRRVPRMPRCRHNHRCRPCSSDLLWRRWYASFSKTSYSKLIANSKGRSRGDSLIGHPIRVLLLPYGACGIVGAIYSRSKCTRGVGHDHI
jgi:hypothetical protein